MTTPITEKTISDFIAYLKSEERSAGTIENYVRHIRRLRKYLGEDSISKERMVAWKNVLIEAGYKATTVNAILVSTNTFLRWIGLENCCVKLLHLQRQVFREGKRELTKAEYNRLVASAYADGKEVIALIMETVCATGIRVSELQYITVEAAKAHCATIALKGKIRTILLPTKLCRKLLKYSHKNKIVSGNLFLTRSGKQISRKQVWAMMKQVCKSAGIESSKVFPHNLRHLFAQTFYRVNHDIVRLADVLGHSSIETTRIYLISTIKESAAQIERLGLVV